MPALVPLASRLIRTVAACCAGATVLALAGCGIGNAAPPGATAACAASSPATVAVPTPLSVAEATDPDAAADLPPALASRGTLTIATDASYAPNEFTEADSDQLIGTDIDLGNAIGRVLGLRVSFVEASFDGILAGIQAGRYDLGMSSFTDTRQRESAVDFVTYFRAGTSIMVQRCDPKGINGTGDLCGRNVGAEAGSTQLDQITRATVAGSVVAACRQAGNQPPVARSFPNQTEVDNALAAGRIDAYLADSPVVDYALKLTGNAFEKVGGTLNTAPYGIAVPKNDGTMTQALQTAVQKLISDGNYEKILDHWGVSSGAIATSQINGAQF